MARRKSDPDRQKPRIVSPEPWTDEPEEAGRQDARPSAEGEGGGGETDDIVDEAFRWSRAGDEEEPMPAPPPLSEADEPAPPSESSSETVSAPSWTSVEPVPDASESEETPSAEDEEAPSPADEEVSRRRPLLSPEDLAKLVPLSSDEELLARGADNPFNRPDAPALPSTLVDEQMRKRIEIQITTEDLQELEAEVTRLYRAVEEKLSSSKALTYEALKKLNEARVILLAQPGLFPVAETRVEEVKVLLNRVTRSERDADKYAWRIFAYNALWLTILIGLAMADRFLALWVLDAGVTPPYELPLVSDAGRPVPLTMAMYFLPWFCMIWGGIGGAIGSLYTLRTYVSEREFDSEYVIHYYAHAPMGAVLGAVVYFMFIGGFFVVGAVSQTADLTNPAQQVLTASSPLLILIALSFGLVQQAVYQMIDRVIRTVTGAAQQEEAQEASPEQPTTTGESE